MSSPHADDAFTIKFDDAVGSMHQRSYRGNKPSGGLWNDIRSQMQPNGVGPTPISTATPPRQRGVAPVAGTSTPRHGSRLKTNLRVPMRGSSTWVALGLVVLLVVSGLYLNQLPKTDTRENQVAWAPGTTVPNPADEIVTASPWASPTAIGYGPEFACNVEPLTAGIIFDMVVNPERESIRRGGDRAIRDLEKPAESGGNSLYWRPLFENKEQFYGTDDPSIRQPIVDTANLFWNCLMTGTAYQVWTLMDPSSVQDEILAQYPVFLDDVTLRAHIEKWGPMRYSASRHHVFPDLGGLDPIQVSRHADDSFGSVTISVPPGEDTPQSAIVIMIPHSDSGKSILGYQKLLLSRAPDGTWWVVAIYFPDTPTGMG